MPCRPRAVVRVTAVAAAVAVLPVVLVHIGVTTTAPVSMAAVRAWIHQPLTPGFLAALGLAGAWLVWAVIATAVAARLCAAATRLARWLPPLRLPRPLQGLTAAVLGASAVTATTAGAAHATTPASTTATPPQPVADTIRTADPPTTVATTDDGPRSTHTVRRGESLSAIADRRLGDHDRWTDIYDLNRGTRFPTGGTLTDPDLIHPGWVLDLPATVAAPPDDNRPPPPAAVDTPPTPEPPTPTVTPEADPTADTPRPDAPADSTCDTTSTDTGRRPVGVALPDGSWVEAGLAVALAATATAVWARRRRHRRHGEDPAALPRMIHQIRRSLHHTAGPGTTTHGAGDTRDRTIPDPDLPDAGDRTGTVPDDAPDPTAPVGGLGLTGPGAPAAARGMLTAALTTGPTHVVMPSTTAAALLGDAGALPDAPRLTLTANLDAALRILETQLMSRSRLLDQHDTDTVADLRHGGHPTPPPLLLIADDTADATTRTAAVLAQGHRLDIHGVVLTPWPDGRTVTVDTDGTTTSDDGGGGRLTVLTTADTIDLIRTVTGAPTDPRPSAADPSDTDGPPDPSPGPAPADATTADTHTPAHPGPADAGPVDPADDRPDTGPRPEGHGGARPEPSGGGHVSVRLLGDARIVDMDTTTPLRAKSFELLVYLAVHDGDATQDAILDDLLPDAPRSRAPHRLHTYVSTLRKTLARTGGPADHLTHAASRYTLNRPLLDVDLWRLRDALRDADHTTDPAERLTALRTAVAAYRGALADGHDYEWIEAHREGVRRRALDAHLTLATATPDPAEALTVLDAAIRHDPYAEPLYQQAMRVHAALGHPDQIRTLRRTLTRRLAEIDATPDDTTTALADQLTTDLRRRPTAPDPRGGHR
ncbi:BTAD domain-containing putative transcriptional regulator [Solwaraspora sp. WMMA2065]|uniref:BTAD domain-containing putative transcriptional regulator n=1 Tax=Solwaraspora sp. WMMA2065 TaxID=3015166 RepID=UPI00259BEC7C|nr:BTAD domain-containing putative transcriptional regulator [Solwaraspora sp. WMMA2065]WJK33162.1 BTAD domain-containing putative transcriptional regulator [Solwaraspora sp. WMMA2065]